MNYKSKKRFKNYQDKWIDHIEFDGRKFADLPESEQKKLIEFMAGNYSVDDRIKLAGVAAIEVEKRKMEMKEAEQVRDTVLATLEEEDSSVIEQVEQISFMDDFTTIKNYDDYGIVFKNSEKVFKQKAADLGDARYVQVKEEHKFLKKHKVNVVDDYLANTLPQELRDEVDEAYTQEKLKTMPVKKK